MPTDSFAEITRTALKWVWIISQGSAPTPQERKQLTGWLLGSEENMRQFIIALLAYATIDGGKPIKRRVLDAWLGPLVTQVAEYYRPPSLPERWRVTRPAVVAWHRPAIAAALLVAIAAAAFVSTRTQEPKWEHFVASEDHFKSVRLTDGTRVALSPRSAADVLMGRTFRKVRLLSGGATFDVFHAPETPFTVEASGVTVQAVGTHFNVRRDSGGVSVDVQEGKVRAHSDRADAGRVVAGQHVRISDDGQISFYSLAAQLENWRRARYVAVDSPLSELAQVYNSYSSQVRVKVEGRACDLPASVSWNTRDGLEGWAMSLADDRRIEVKTVNGEILVRERGDRTSTPCIPDSLAGRGGR